MIRYLAIDQDKETHKRESAVWLARDIHAVRVSTMNDGIKKALKNQYLYIVINAANIDYQDKFKMLRDVTNDPIFIAAPHYTMREQNKALSLGADFFGQISDNPYENVEAVISMVNRGDERAKLKKEPAEIISRGDILIARRQRTVVIGNADVHLNKDETNILYYLMCNFDSVLSYGQIYDYIRDGDAERLPFNAIRSAMKRLRGKLNEAAPNRNIIENIRGIGYRISKESLKEEPNE
jgi:DNA-binding response OmpR family regulator